MKKSYVLMAVFVALIGVVGALVLFSRDTTKESSNMGTSDTTTTMQEKTNESTAGTQQSDAIKSGMYTEYDPVVLTNTTGKRLLFFHASWCVQCRALEKSILEGNIPEDVTIFKVDYDSNQKLRQQYGVTIQTTLVLLDDAGNEVKKYVAYDEPTLESVLTNAL